MPQYKKKKKNDIPDRWTDYQAVGKRIPQTRFIAFKVPLNRYLRNRLRPSEAFGPDDLLHMLEEEKQQLGLIIDLTFTTRYYKPEDLPESVHYVKIFTAGHEVPSDPTILSFKKAVRGFLRDNEDNDKLIGVHCTHGLNRTGYLVCRYLIDVDGIEPKKAIELFNTSRGHKIERENYIDDLQRGPKRSNEGMNEPDQEPIKGGSRPPYAPLTQTQARHHSPIRNQRPWSRDPGHMKRSNEDMRIGPPPDWGMDQRFVGGPGLLPPPPGFYPKPGLFPDPPPFTRPPYRPRPSEWARRGPPPACPPPFPMLPQYRFDGPQEGPPDTHHHHHHHHHHHRRQQQQEPQGPQRKSWDQPRSHKKTKRDRRT